MANPRVTDEEIISLIKQRGPMSFEELLKATGYSQFTLRQRLLKLIRDDRIATTRAAGHVTSFYIPAEFFKTDVMELLERKTREIEWYT